MTTQTKVLREEKLLRRLVRDGDLQAVLRIVDHEGQHVADLATINAANVAEKLSVTNPIRLNK